MLWKRSKRRRVSGRLMANIKGFLHANFRRNTLEDKTGNRLLKPGTHPEWVGVSRDVGRTKRPIYPALAGLPSPLPAFRRGRVFSADFFVCLLSRGFGGFVCGPFFATSKKE